MNNGPKQIFVGAYTIFLLGFIPGGFLLNHKLNQCLTSRDWQSSCKLIFYVNFLPHACPHPPHLHLQLWSYPIIGFYHSLTHLPCMRRSQTRRSEKGRHMSGQLYSVWCSKRNVKTLGTRERVWTGNIWQVDRPSGHSAVWGAEHSSLLWYCDIFVYQYSENSSDINEIIPIKLKAMQRKDHGEAVDKTLSFGLFLLELAAPE